MTVYLQSTTSEPNRINKTITTNNTYTGTLREESSVLDPIILFNADPQILAGYNYMTIPEFANRSYFITDISAIRNGLTQITGHVDVLYTYRAQILTQKVVTMRQENNWNLYIEDGIFHEYANPLIVTKKFPSGFDSQSFVLSVAGGTD